MWSDSKRLRISRLDAFFSALAKDLGLPFEDVAQMLAYVAMTGRDPLAGNYTSEVENYIRQKAGMLGFKAFDAAKRTWRDKKGVLHIAGFIDLDVRIKCAIALLPYTLRRPKPVDPIEPVKIDMKRSNKIGQEMRSMSPEMRTAMENLAAALAKAQRRLMSEGAG